MDHRRRFSAFVARGHDPRPTIVEALEFVRDFLPQSSLGPRGRDKLAVVVEELVANALRHGGSAADVTLWLALEDRPDDHGGAVSVALEDDGPVFDPTRAGEFGGPDPCTGGGVGLAIVRAWGEDIAYSRRENRNSVQLRIR